MAEIFTQNNKKVDNFNRTGSDSYLQRILSRQCIVAMPTPGDTRIEKSVTRGRQNNSSHECQRLSQHESRVAKACDSGGIDCLSRWILQSSKTKLAGLPQFYINRGHISICNCLSTNISKRRTAIVYKLFQDHNAAGVPSFASKNNCFLTDDQDR
jgi:hypothetical protein